MMMDVIGVVIAAVAAAGAFATTRGAMQLKALETIRAERLDLEKEKTAKERYYRELAEAQVKSMYETQKILLENTRQNNARLEAIFKKLEEHLKNKQ